MRSDMSSALCGVLLVVGACGETSGPAAVSGDKRGLLTLGLVGTSPTGDKFRLRHASFDVFGCGDNYRHYPAGTAGTVALPSSTATAAAGTGVAFQECTSFTLSSDDDPDAVTLSMRMKPGYYTVTLNGAWSLEEASEAGWAPASAVLLSAQTQEFYIWDGATSYVSYELGVGGDLIAFQHGDLNIGIQVRRPGETFGAAGTGNWPTPPAPVAGSGANWPTPVTPEAGSGL